MILRIILNERDLSPERLICCGVSTAYTVESNVRSTIVISDEVNAATDTRIVAHVVGKEEKACEGSK
tara:strand:- start:1 stop:201 length:201 start_codon:yes stop_codon:yes gene_type:complete